MDSLALYSAVATQRQGSVPSISPARLLGSLTQPLPTREDLSAESHATMSRMRQRVEIDGFVRALPLFLPKA